MKVNCIDESGNIVTKEIEIDLSDVSKADIQKAFKKSTLLDPYTFIREGIHTYTSSEIQEMFKNCAD